MPLTLLPISPPSSSAPSAWLQRSFADLEDSEGENRGGGFQSTASSRQTRARRKAEREARKREP